ncbi:MAG: divergent polysaccharide deacetylase family protein [Aliarcobacter sp.]|nr:divergent polysaccharide deacetylase family protein [Aliarcobacter sp.]
MKLTIMNQKKNKSKKKQTVDIQKNRLTKIFLLIFLITIIASALSYFIMKNENHKETQKTDNILETKKDVQKNQIVKKEEEIKIFEDKKPSEYFDELIKTPEKHDKFEEYTQEFEKDIIEKNENEELINKENEKVLKKIEEIKEEKKKDSLIKKDINEEEKKEIIKKIPVKIDEKSIITKKDTFAYNKKDKPKLVILIDDVSTKAQKDKILNIGYTVNMAFLPPTKVHKDSARIAQDLPFYMIHFPMQASSAFKGEEIDTLKISDSYETIEKRVKQLRAWYPKAIYTNNHTGSVFTENEEAVDKLFRALKKYNFIFVDSRTSSKSVIKKYAKKYDMPYIVRNTFIDNDRDFKSIQNQLKKAIEIAKKQGYAIAIGHPHNITLQVLKESKHLLKDVEPIYINKLPYL